MSASSESENLPNGSLSNVNASEYDQIMIERPKISVSRSWFKQSLRLLHHEFRRGELTIICLAIILAVATVFSLTGFSHQIKQALVSNSTSYIAADRVLRSSRVIDDRVLNKSSELSLKQAQKIETQSMAFAGDSMLLSELNAVSNQYPLRGELLIKSAVDQKEATIANAPMLGNVWVEPTVLSRLDVNLGDQVDIGEASFTITAIVTQIPDRSFRALIAGPIIILNINDMPSTQLIQPGSRMTYKYLFAGELPNILAFEKWIKPSINDTQRWYDAKSAQSRLAETLDMAEKYLSLASMLGIVLAAVAIAVASRRYGQRHQPMVAVFKALGASLSHIKKLYYLHWTLLSVFSICIGLLVGYILLLLGMNMIEHYLSLQNTYLGFTPFIIAIITGVLSAGAFAINPINNLINTSPLAVIRGFTAEKTPKWGLHQVLPLVALLILLIIFSQNLFMSIALLLGGIVVSMVLLFIAKVLMNTGRTVGSKAGKSWHLAFANLRRRANENSVQLVSFTLAIKLLLLITVMKTSIIAEWQLQSPENTPNHYLLNIANEQVEPLASFMEDNRIQSEGFYQVTRGRLSAINNDILISKEEAAANDKNSSEGSMASTRQGVGRELGLTWRNDIPYNTNIIEGSWWKAGDTRHQVSVEQRMAERLNINIDDNLTFDVEGRKFSAIVTSIRNVNWQSGQLNFIMIFNEGVLQSYPSTTMTAWMVPESVKDNLYRFLHKFPTISFMDFGAILKQLNNVIEQVSIGIEFILVLVVVAGCLVLVAQVQASMEERERELAILRTLGAKGSLLRNSVLLEFVALGAIAGLMASIAMEIAVYVLQTQVFDMQASFHLTYWLLAIFSGAGFVGMVGLLSCWRLLHLSSVTLIRRTM